MTNQDSMILQQLATSLANNNSVAIQAAVDDISAQVAALKAAMIDIKAALKALGLMPPAP